MKRKYLVVAISIVAIVTAGAVWLAAQGPLAKIGQAAVSPTNTVLNTPTSVIFTALIDTATLNPTTVELLQVNADGSLVRSVGRLYDNGQNGDSQPGDKTFTSRVTLNESTIGRIYFRVTGDFRGGHQNAISDLIPFDVDPFKLPPDPAEAGKQTIEGIDSDHDGIRDDLQRFIAITSASDPLVQRALRQSARAGEAFLLGSGDNAGTYRDAQAVQRSINCLYFVQPSRARELRRQLQAALLNTPARADKWFELDAHLGGSVFPDDDGLNSASQCNSDSQ